MTNEERNAKAREWYKVNKEQVKSKKKDYYKTHKEQRKAYKIAHKEQVKEYYQTNIKELKAKMKAYYQTHKKEHKVYYEAHKQEINEYNRVYYKNDINSHGKSKGIIRRKSQYYLNKYGTKIPGYQIHHCFGYEDPSKFIYCSKEIHLKIHQFLRDNNIAADSDHYDKIKHLLDDTVIVYGV